MTPLGHHRVAMLKRKSYMDIDDVINDDDNR